MLSLVKLHFHLISTHIMAPTRQPFICLQCARTLRSQPGRNVTRSLATATQRKRVAPSAQDEEPAELPRWQQTPPAMRMPVRLRPLPKQPEWKVNKDPKLLDEMYDRFVGRAGEAAKDQVQSTRGRDLLPEEVKVSLRTSEVSFTCH